MRISFPLATTPFVHHRISMIGQEEHRCVIGGGLRGLVWGVLWLEAGDRVTIIDDRQEIGTPSRRVGWLEPEGIGYEWLQNHIDLSAAMYVSHSDEHRSGLRVEWLEKLLTIQFLKMGGLILSRAFASRLNDELIIEGTSPITMPTDWTTIHNASGHQPSCPGADAHPLSILSNHRWEGGIISSQAILSAEIEDSPLILERSDNTLEIWFSQGRCPPSTHWLELLETYRPPQMNALEISTHIEMILIQHREAHDL